MSKSRSAQKRLEITTESKFRLTRSARESPATAGRRERTPMNSVPTRLYLRELASLAGMLEKTVTNRASNDCDEGEKRSHCSSSSSFVDILRPLTIFQLLASSNCHVKRKADSVSPELRA